MSGVATVKMDTGQHVKLGRIRPAAAFDYGRFRVLKYADGSQRVALRLGAYLNMGTAAAAVPDTCDLTPKAMASIRRMYDNDRLGDCVWASLMHMLGVWSGNDAGDPILATDQEVAQQYAQVCGPGDQGCVISDVNEHWKTHGAVAGGKTYKIDGYVAVDWTNKVEVMVAIYLMGGLKLGVNLPSAWGEGADGSTWDVTNSQIVGGHDVPAISYNPKGPVIATWAGLRQMTWAAFLSRKWLEECWAILSPQWYGDDRVAPNGVNAGALSDDLVKLGAGTVPDIAVPPLDFSDFL